MLTVFKYEIPAKLGGISTEFVPEFTLMIPNPGIILKMDVQPSRSASFVIWALVDETGHTRERRFVFLGTGHTTQHPNLQFIDSWVSDGLVFHLFEVLEVV